MEEYQNQEGYPYQSRRQLRVSDLLYAVKKRLVLIVICAMIGLIVGISLSVVSRRRADAGGNGRHVLRTLRCH